jgi:hypothetical protein
MLQIMILVCSVNVSPVDCQTETALDIISGPQTASAISCGMQGQALIASTSFARQRPGEYVKIKCTHLKDTKMAQKI